MKKVLLLGDSIRMSYQPLVREMLASEAEVVGPAENCQYSLYTLTRLGSWLAELGTPDIVHWNNGLHDIGHNPNRAPVQMPLEVYRGNIGFILQQLLATGAQVIWAKSTPVHPQRPFSAEQWSWKNEEIDSYNAAALELMVERQVPVNGLHALVAGDFDLYLAEDQLHLSEEGKEKCAAAVADKIRALL